MKLVEMMLQQRRLPDRARTLTDQVIQAIGYGEWAHHVADLADDFRSEGP